MDPKTVVSGLFAGLGGFLIRTFVDAQTCVLMTWPFPVPPPFFWLHFVWVFLSHTGFKLVQNTELKELKIKMVMGNQLKILCLCQFWNRFDFKHYLRLIENRNYLFRKPKMHFPRTGSVFLMLFLNYVFIILQIFMSSFKA